MDFVRILKTVMPAVVVLVAGLFGINFVYNTYMQDAASTVITLEPAAGGDAAMSVEETATGVEDHAMDAAPAVEETAGDVVVDCVAAEEAAKAAEGTDGAEAATKAVEECHAAKAAQDSAASAEAPAEAAPAVEGEAAPH